jgi:hypothetical protein
MASKSALWYQENPEGREKKQKYDAKFNKKPSAVKKRVESNRANRNAGTYGNGDGKDYDHKTKRFIKASTNRGRPSEKWKGSR